MVAALYEAFDEGEHTPLAGHHMETAIAELVPLSRSMAPQIGRLRAEAGSRWQQASASGDPLPDDVQPEELPPVPSRPRRAFEA